jgi:diguanylate cyclase (GGDEF)-like protein
MSEKLVPQEMVKEVSHRGPLFPRFAEFFLFYPKEGGDKRSSPISLHGGHFRLISWAFFQGEEWMGIRVLIVDDEEVVLESLKKIVEHGGYDCLVARSGEEALRILQEERVDILICDIRMPGMDGMELLREVRAHFPDVDAMMMTGFDTRETFLQVIEAGAADFIAKPFHQDELLAKIKRIVRERELKAELLYLSIHDSLTGLYNRRYFYQRLQEEVERAKRQGRHLALVILDVDHFKDYNDSHGHLDGDEVLRTLAQILASSIRQNVDTAYRYGGDEFAVLLVETDLEQGRKVAERIRKAFADKKIDHCTLSLGVASLTPQGGTMEDLIREADEAMYRAKRSGGNRVAHTQTLRERNAL